MNKRRSPATEEELVHAFADLFDEVGLDTPEEIDAALREGGHDPDTIAARMKSVAERALARSPLNCETEHNRNWRLKGVCSTT